jgi:hypothetical protein
VAIPTPTVGDSKSARNSTAKRNRIPPTGIHAGNTLTDFVTMWPTPTRIDAEKAYASPPGPTNDRGRETLSGAVQAIPTPTSSRRTGLQSHGVNVVTGSLNPTWVEWLMGFPFEWTDCGDSVTRSSRKLRNGSGKGSSRGPAK